MSEDKIYKQKLRYALHQWYSTFVFHVLTDVIYLQLCTFKVVSL
jgi:hypothetical protein